MTDPKKANWTIMVYISADDVLANFAVESLKQLRNASSKDIIVVAQFDANRNRDARLYRFDGTTDKDLPIEDNKVELIRRPVNMADPKTLETFVNWVADNPKCQAEHYGLFLWGHGVELLLDEDGTKKEKDLTSAAKPQVGSNVQAEAEQPVRKYLTPSKLKSALKNTKLKLNILGIDACSMGMIEVASELKGCADFMVASQEDVPDASFPYQQILARLKEPNTTVEGICTQIPRDYKLAFQDYLATPRTGINNITLSSLRLENVDTITTPLKTVAEILLNSAYDDGIGQQIMNARSTARSFVFGMFADLFDFCSQLKASNVPRELKTACENVCIAIDARNQSGVCIIENQTDEEKGKERCHGISIYFPYFDGDENQQLRQLVEEGKTDIANQLSALVKGASPSVLHKVRNARIEELEEDFDLLKTFNNTGWNEFIKYGWSFILATGKKRELDRYYSAQQCALNLLSLYKLVMSRQRAA
jgi:hypothetical protein